MTLEESIIATQISTLGGYIVRMTDLLDKISFSLERSASAAEATHKLYKSSNEDTKRHMQAREEREREQNERAREDFAMAKERHESFMRAAVERDKALKNIQGGELSIIKP